jgi:hypothetical protein
VAQVRRTVRVVDGGRDKETFHAMSRRSKRTARQKSKCYEKRVTGAAGLAKRSDEGLTHPHASCVSITP